MEFVSKVQSGLGLYRLPRPGDQTVTCRITVVFVLKETSYQYIM